MDYAGVLIPMQCFLFKKHLTNEPRWKTKLQKAHEVLAGAKECQVKIPSANLALCGTQRGKEAGVPSSDTLRSLGERQCVEESRRLQKSQQGWGWTCRNWKFPGAWINWSKTTTLAQGGPVLICILPPWRRLIQPRKISARDSSFAPTHGLNAVTTAGRIFSTLGKRE